ncbi:MAG: type II toxin-antitoxin system VapC family toxin [Planctomycetaceae bacterium]|nr:type II toxin-antitoxin system VapC family toxin [Planctomycetaceae bacterium]
MAVLLDTDICSHYVRGNPLVGKKCIRFAGAIHVSALTVGEILVWALRSGTPDYWMAEIREFLGFVEVIDVTVEVAEQFAVLRAQLLRAGNPKPPLDLFIAATAIAHDLQLITHNTKDYAPIPGLQFDDWLLP